jgi:hypothetical protein
MPTVTCPSRKSLQTRVSISAFIRISIERKTDNGEQRVREMTQENIRLNVLERRRDFKIKSI